MKTIMKALNIVYDEDERRSFLRLTLHSLTFTIGAIGFILLAIAAIVIMPVLLRFVGLGGESEFLLRGARWPVLLVLSLYVLYRYGPSRDEAKWRWITPGWLGGSLLFSWYVSSFGNYNETYGSLGAIIGFMTWIWLSSIAVLLGAEVNAEMEHQTARDTTEAPREPMGKRGATMADKIGRSKTG